MQHMLGLWKSDMMKLFPSEDPRRLVDVIMLGMSWPSVHGVLEALTQENIGEYSDRIFRLAQGDESAANRTIIGQCSAHTMQGSRWVGLRRQAHFHCLSFADHE